MDFPIRCPKGLERLDLSVFRTLNLDDLINPILRGLIDAILQAIPTGAVLPAELCAQIGPVWRDPKFQDDLKKKLKEVIAAALSSRIPTGTADAIADYLVEEVVYPLVKHTGDRLLERLCPGRRPVA